MKASLDGKYYAKVTVNRTNKKDKNYAEIIIHVYNSEKVLITSIKTGVGDYNKWFLRWDNNKESSILILENSDVGNKKWVVTNLGLIELNSL